MLTGAAGFSEGEEFFEKNIRPIFVEACYPCHSHQAEKLKGDLYLDSREGWERGGASGPVIIPGDPDQSRLIQAVRYTDEDLQMPPKDKRLSEAQIQLLEQWVRMGAPDPRSLDTNLVPSAKTANDHWAFQPVIRPELPTVNDKNWPRSPMDYFILNKLESKNLHPSSRADKRTLIRRAYFDLIGLPPSYEAVQAFEQDVSPGAYEKVIDQLLASPRYGERWGRHWLDVARYADTKGYVFEEERRYPFSYTYRDYVIRSFNEDLPFNRFIIEQIAADQLDLGEDNQPLAALGFLTLGRRFLNNQPDIIDDRIDVVTRGFMGLTVACARCHDHKYDPIPTEDYYSLYGVFASSEEPDEKPILHFDPDSKAYREFKKELEKRETKWNEFRETSQQEALSLARKQTGEYLLAAHDARHLENRSRQEALIRERKLGPVIAFRWIESLAQWKQSFHPVFEPWFRLSALEKNEFEQRAPEILKSLLNQNDTEQKINARIIEAFEGKSPKSMADVAGIYGKLFEKIESDWQSAQSDHDAFDDPVYEELRQILYADDAPPNIPLDQATQLLDVPTQQKIRQLKREVDNLYATHPGAPARAMVMVDKPRSVKPVVFKRGDPHNRGQRVPRRFLALLAGENRKPFEHGSGRLELAKAIADPRNPLTSRVIVNRVWMHHFGAPLVGTPSDFGMRAEPPTHPRLLDYLASWFVDNGWSLKKLHKLIMLSSAYQQSSGPNRGYRQIDPDNALLWRMNRQRLEFEPMRDSILAVAGNLDLSMGGQPVEISENPSSNRRTVYSFIERQNLPAIFRTFDLASPDTSSPGRFETTVPQQALFMMNSPFILEQARRLETRLTDFPENDIEGRVRFLYETAFQRAPDAEEIQLAREFIKAGEAHDDELPAPPTWQYGYGEYDSTSQTILSFTPLPHFTGDAWQGGEQIPDEKLGWVLLNANGGHPGNDSRHAAIRRWRAPDSGRFTVSGLIKHPSDQGNGIRAWIAASGGELGRWTAKHESHRIGLENISLEKGEFLDFIVDCNGNEAYDGFEWSVDIETEESSRLGGLRRWNSTDDFAGPSAPVMPSTPWGRYCQIILMSNEMAFVD